MSDSDPYGFAIYPDISLFSISYEIVDLSSDEVVFKIHKEGTFKPTFYMYDESDKEILTAKKISAWSGIYRMFKQDIRYATLDYSSSCCSSQTEIEVGTKRFLGSRIKGTSYEFVNKYGNLAFYFQRHTRIIRSEYILEVYDTIEPEIAIMSSIIIDTIIRAQQAAAATATIS